MLTKARTKIGPQHQGRKMSLKAFEFAKVEDGHVYELARGFIVVSEVPRYYHAAQVEVIRDFLRDHKRAYPGSIHMVLGTMECKLLVPKQESERHPDLAVYLSRPAGRKDRIMWRTWIPELVIEVVSPGSVDRDYVDKREEYWTLGIKEYWIVDAAKEKALILRRGRSDWTEKELFRNDVCETKLLPGFKLPCRVIFDAAVEAGEEE
jgi:Putative restriction endonuclease